MKTVWDILSQQMEETRKVLCEELRNAGMTAEEAEREANQAMARAEYAMVKKLEDVFGDAASKKIICNLPHIDITQATFGDGDSRTNPGSPDTCPSP